MKLEPFKLENYFAKYEFSTRYVLCGSDNETMSLKELLALADRESLKLWEDLRLGYTHVYGLPELRNEISKLYKNVDAESVGTFAGAGEAIFILMNVLLNSGDHVIVPSPCYQSLASLPQKIGAEVSTYPIREGGKGWYFDVQDLKKAIRSNTRLIVINFPHNPTSAHIDSSTLEQIIAIARETNAYLFSDEVYRFSEHAAGRALPAACDLYEKAASLGVMSKTLGFAGLRVGWLATQDKDLLTRCMDYKCYISLCNSGTSEILSLMALRAKEQIIARNLNIIRSNLNVLDAFFEKHHSLFSWKRPSAGSTAFPKLLAEVPIDAFVEDLIQKEGVMLLPATAYDFTGNYFRIGFSRQDMPEALEHLENYITKQFWRSCT